MPLRRSSNLIPPSPVVVVVEDQESPMKQGIVTILGADCDRNGKAGSLRRTLSADMSSKKWLEQNGFFSPIKTTASTRVIAKPAADHSSSSSESSEEEFDDNNPNQDEVWRSIQANKETKELQKPPQNGVWSSLILTQKSDNSLLPPPPPVKRSASGLSEKSLEICTESLGSETGSDGFSNYGDEEREEKQRSEEDSSADLHMVKYSKSPARPFPPPLPSIAGIDGASLHMQSHRENGRLVVEAVSVAPRNYFHAQRQDGRLLLTLMHGGPSIVEVEEEEKGELDDIEMEGVGGEDGESGGDGGGGGEQKEEQNLSLPSGMISVHKSGLVMKKLMAVGNINPKWSNKINMPTDHHLMTGEGDGDEELPIPQSLPPRPPVARLITTPPPPAAASFNAYEYFWRSKPAVSGGFINLMTTSRNKINQDLVGMKASKTEQFEPYMRGCKEARRSLIWEPYCIATS